MQTENLLGRLQERVQAGHAVAHELQAGIGAELPRPIVSEPMKNRPISAPRAASACGMSRTGLTLLISA